MPWARPRELLPGAEVNEMMRSPIPPLTVLA